MKAVFVCLGCMRNLVRGTHPTIASTLKLCAVWPPFTFDKLRANGKRLSGTEVSVLSPSKQHSVAQLAVLLLTLLLTCIPCVQADTTITITNVDPARVGFNDQTSVAPIGGNAGVTLGEQRLQVFEFAADVWASPVEMVLQATFSPLPCDMTSAVLGAASPIRLFASFSSDVEQRQADVWYPAALSNAIAVQDLSPGPADAKLLEVP